MQVEGVKSVVVSEGVQKTQKFRVAQNAKIFMMLSSSLYNDKIAAPVRELGTNAIDAHIKGKNDNPFIVHVPTWHEPYFSVRDFGPGMDELELDELYTVYGCSDKTESNEYVGAWGLGSKSPLAYVKSGFTVTSRKAGKQYSCIVSLNEEGEPELTYFPTIDTKEPSGLEVRFDVNRSDVNTFQYKIQDIYSHFGKYLPKTNAITLNKFKYKEEDSLYCVPEHQVYGYSQSYAIMGYVKYPIDDAHFADYSNLLKYGYHYNFAIGEVEMNISREGLQYNKKTVTAIKNRLDKVLEKLSVNLQKKIDECKSLHQVMQVIADNSSQFELVKSKLKFKGASISNNNSVQNIEAEVFYCHGSKLRRHVTNNVNINSGNPPKFGYFLFNDTDKNHLTVQRYLTAKNIRVTQLLKRECVDTLINGGYICEDDITYVSKIIDKAREELKSDTTRRGGFGEYSKKKVFTFEFSPVRPQACWKEAEIDLDDGGVFIEINRYQPNKSFAQTVQDLRNVLAIYTSLLKDSELEIVGVKTNEVAKYSEDSNWTKFDDFIKSSILDYVKKNNLEDSFYTALKYCDSYCDAVRNMISTYGVLTNDGKITSGFLFEFIQTMKAAKKFMDDSGLTKGQFSVIKQMIGYDPIKHASKYNEDALLKQYPLIQAIDKTNNPTLKNELIKYVLAVDSGNF